MNILSALLLLLAVSAFRPAGGGGGGGGAVGGDWNIATGYSVKFSTSGDVGGIFKGLSGVLHFDDGNPAAGIINVSVEVATLNTGNALMNQHAKSAEWLDAGKYPKITFVSSRVVKAGAAYQAIGTLAMHGVSKPFTLPFAFQRNGTGGLFHAAFMVNRNAFGIGKPGDVDDNISIELSVPVTPK
jgi:polyisoprenoid-binding protein YceI